MATRSVLPQDLEPVLNYRLSSPRSRASSKTVYFFGGGDYSTILNSWLGLFLLFRGLRFDERALFASHAESAVCNSEKLFAEIRSFIQLRKFFLLAIELTISKPCASVQSFITFGPAPESQVHLFSASRLIDQVYCSSKPFKMIVARSGSSAFFTTAYRFRAVSGAAEDHPALQIMSAFC